MAALAKPVKVTAQEWDESFLALLQLQRYTEALSTLQQAVAEASGAPRFARLQELFQQLPEPVRRTEQAQRLSLRLLGNLPGGVKQVEAEAQTQWDAGEAWPFLHVFMAWALSEQEADAQSLEHAEAALEQ